MNMQLSVKKTNTFSKQTPPVPNVVGNMFGSKSKVIFKNGLRSVDISKHNFINFASNKEPNYIKFIQKEINKLKQGTIDILKEYKEKCQIDSRMQFRKQAQKDSEGGGNSFTAFFFL